MPSSDTHTTKPPSPSVVVEGGVDLDRLARAVGKHETGNCTLGYGKFYNNCVGLKNGRTAPCPKIGKNNMCIYARPEDSYEAFKKVWKRWYGGGLPTIAHAKRWSGGDNYKAWHKNILHFYYNTK